MGYLLVVNALAKLPAILQADYIGTKSGFDTRLEGTEFQYLKGATIEAGGKLELIAAKKSITELFKKEKNSVVWQAMQDKSSITETANLPRFNGPTLPTFKADGGIAGLGTTTPVAGGGSVTTFGGITIATVGEATTITTAGVMLNAALTSLATQASISAVNNKEKLSAILKDVTSKSAIKNLAIAMALAGISNTTQNWGKETVMLKDKLGNPFNLKVVTDWG